MEANIKFAKIRGDAKIPSKRVEDAGLDIYACFDEDYILINPHETKIIPTGIASACDHNYCFIIKERGSTGSKGIAVRMGVVDSGYRDGWMIGLTNTTNKALFITKLNGEETLKNQLTSEVKYDDIDYTEEINEFTQKLLPNCIFYPYEKAIAQALIVPVPNLNVEEIPYKELKNIASERGLGALGSSGK